MKNPMRRELPPEYADIRMDVESVVFLPGSHEMLTITLRVLNTGSDVVVTLTTLVAVYMINPFFHYPPRVVVTENISNGIITVHDPRQGNIALTPGSNLRVDINLDISKDEDIHLGIPANKAMVITVDFARRVYQNQLDSIRLIDLPEGQKIYH